MLLATGSQRDLAWGGTKTELKIIRDSLPFADPRRVCDFECSFCPQLAKWNGSSLLVAANTNLCIIDTFRNERIGDIYSVPGDVIALGIVKDGFLPGCNNFLVLVVEGESQTLRIYYLSQHSSTSSYHLTMIRNWKKKINQERVYFTEFVALSGHCLLFIQEDSSCLLLDIDSSKLVPIVIGSHSLVIPIPVQCQDFTVCKEDGSLLLLALSGDRTVLHIFSISSSSIDSTPAVREMRRFESPTSILLAALTRRNDYIALVVDCSNLISFIDGAGGIINVLNEKVLDVFITEERADQSCIVVGRDVAYISDGIYIKKINLPTSSRILYEIISKVNEGLSYDYLLESINTVSEAEIVELLRGISPALRKTQLFEVLSSLTKFMGTPLGISYSSFFKALARLNYFWEVGVASTQDLASVIKSMLGVDLENKMEFIPEALIVGQNLCEEAMEHLFDLFCDYGDHYKAIRPMVNRALQIKAIHHRISSVVQILLSIRDYVDANVERFESLNIVALSTFYHSFSEVFDGPLAVDLSLLQECLGSYPVMAEAKLEYLFHGSLADDNLLYRIDRADEKSSFRSHKIREAIGGLVIQDAACQTWCMSCGSPLISGELVKETFMDVPFWYHSFTSQCTCGHVLPIQLKY